MFLDRKDAGRKLDLKLAHYKNKAVIVLAIPKGGVEVGFEVASFLGAQFSIIVSRKLPFPHEPESGFGAISEDGSIIIFERYKEILPKGLIEQIIRQQRLEIKRRIEVLRQGKELPDIKDKIVILVDDGIAMGSTMRASILLCKNKKAKKIIVAVPVCGPDAVREFSKLVDEFVVLETPQFFHAVAQLYTNWYDVSDEEVIEILKKSSFSSSGLNPAGGCG